MLVDTKVWEKQSISQKKKEKIKGGQREERKRKLNYRIINTSATARLWVV